LPGISRGRGPRSWDGLDPSFLNVAVLMQNSGQNSLPSVNPNRVAAYRVTMATALLHKLPAYARKGHVQTEAGLFLAALSRPQPQKLSDGLGSANKQRVPLSLLSSPRDSPEKPHPDV